MVVPEFIQENCTPAKLAAAVDVLLCDAEARQRQIAQIADAAAWLGQDQFTPSERAAETVLSVVGNEARKPAVLQVLPALHNGGVERGTVETAAALTAAGFRAVVASAGGPMAHEIEQAGGTHITLPLASKNPLTIIANIKRLRRVITRHKIDIVHARSRAPAWSAFFAARQTGVPFVTTFHSAYGAGSAIKRLYNSAMARGLRVIAISNFVADYAERTYGIARTIMHVIPRGVDISVFDREKVAPQRTEALRRAWNIAGDMPVILCPGRLTRWKGQSVLIDALAELHRRDFICVIVGNGKDTPYGRELASSIRRHGLERNVMIVDTCRDMPAAYKLASLVVVPSTRPEGFGRTVIEAQAMGAPVIATDHGGARETVIPDKTGWLAIPGDADSLARLIDLALNQTETQKQEMAARAIAHIRANFTTATMTAQTLAVYRGLLPISPADKGTSS
ncbi:MAG: glycosyltransferase [Alphaproteobacteria bacterium]|nr:glycosyltransferase [Alphaproteobacteria bacterium]